MFTHHHLSGQQKALTGLILTLVLIGLIDQAIRNPFSIFIPLLIVGILVYLYKYPPAWLIKLSRPNSPYAVRGHRREYTRRSASKGRKYPFRVIDGKKKKSL